MPVFTEPLTYSVSLPLKLRQYLHRLSPSDWQTLLDSVVSPSLTSTKMPQNSCNFINSSEIRYKSWWQLTGSVAILFCLENQGLHTQPIPPFLPKALNLLMVACFSTNYYKTNKQSVTWPRSEHHWIQARSTADIVGNPTIKIIWYGHWSAIMVLSTFLWELLAAIKYICLA